MKDEYDFSKAKKNPFAGTFKGKYDVTIEHKEYRENFEIEIIRNNEGIWEDTRISKTDNFATDILKRTQKAI